MRKQIEEVIFGLMDKLAGTPAWTTPEQIRDLGMDAVDEIVDMVET